MVSEDRLQALPSVSRQLVDDIYTQPTQQTQYTRVEAIMSAKGGDDVSPSIRAQVNRLERHRSQANNVVAQSSSANKRLFTRLKTAADIKIMYSDIITTDLICRCGANSPSKRPATAQLPVDRIGNIWKGYYSQLLSVSPTETYKACAPLEKH
ncbi:hypothetical protein CSUB01_05474 [Colletotrichum sublineola]|uniref:Uncharacterized protein n=1 Tax=Colletotrichum sublineola TaxID=1173701 RepID=A0A066XGW1_COLSU|nr:hypothetical protein CSUB01_05474 [Colletotrichum sublineola]